MTTTSRFSLSPDQEAQAQALAKRLHELLDEELVDVARLLISKPEREIFGQTEFQVRDLLHQAGAKAFQEHLRQKKTATGDAV